MLSREQYRDFLLSARLNNTIPLGSDCGLRCVFCSSKSDIPGSRTVIPRITREEFEDALQFVELQRQKSITLAGSEVTVYGEPFLHPQLVDFVEIINQRYPWVEVGVETCGVYCSSRLVAGLKRLRNFGVVVSVNTLDEGLRRQYLGVDGRRSIRRLLDSGYPIRAVHLMNFGDPDVLCRDLEELLAYDNVAAFVIRRIDYTRYTPADGVEIAKRSVETYIEHLQAVTDRFDDPRLLAQLLQLEYDFGDLGREQRDGVDRRVAGLVKRHGTGLVLCCPESSYEFLRQSWNNLTLVCVPNETFGGSIVCGGLITFQDIRAALARALDSGEVREGALLAIPEDMLNPNAKDLLGEALYHFQDSTGFRVVVR